MPISIVVGGQFGSEGKGKVAHHLAREYGSDALLVRVGGSNSGHTAYDAAGQRYALRQLPVGAIDGNPMIIAAGSYVDPEVLLEEIERLGIGPERLTIDYKAKLITEAHRQWEQASRLGRDIGSTVSGTGASVIASAARGSASLDLASPSVEDEPRLTRFVGDTATILDNVLYHGGRVIVEGTQGFGLSLNHGDWPYVTSRDTTAAGFLSEVGRGPADVDDVVLVIRTHPIRVAGHSGALPRETNWEEVGKRSGTDRDLTERTTVTGNVRRIGLFDPEVVMGAIRANAPTRIVLNHVDHIDWSVRDGTISEVAMRELEVIERAIGRIIDLLGTSEHTLIQRPGVGFPLLKAVN